MKIYLLDLLCVICSKNRWCNFNFCSRLNEVEIDSGLNINHHQLSYVNVNSVVNAE